MKEGTSDSGSGKDASPGTSKTTTATAACRFTAKFETGANEVLATSSPDRYFIPPYLGSRGWIGIWLDEPTPDWREVAELIVDSYRLIAPKRLADLVEKRPFELENKDPD